MSYVILPGEGPCLRCLFGEAPAIEHAQTCDQVGILAPVAHLIASFQATEAIKLLAGQKDAVERKLWKADLWNRHFKTISVDHLKKNPCSSCQRQDYIYLSRKSSTQAVTLCGRNAVQILQPKTGKLDFKKLAAKFPDDADILFNEHLLRCKLSPYEITIFANGRAIIKGTEDAGQAKSLYAKYVGA